MSFLPALDTAKSLRLPLFEPTVGPKQRIESLTDYMLLTAYWSAELSEHRFGLMEELKPLDYEWYYLEGWEPFRRNRTEGGVDAAKAQVRPDLWDAITDARWKIARLTEEIDRLERDATKASRAYTMLTGG